MKFAILATVFCSLWPATAADRISSTHAPALLERAKPYLDAAQAAGNTFVSVSSASGMPNLSADSLATAFGSNLAPSTEIGAAPYPTNLGGISLQVVDVTGAVRLAQLLYVSPSQINYLVPAGTAPGTATMNIIDGTGNMLSSTGQIQPVAPGLFTAAGDGSGVVAATAYRLVDLQIPGPVTVYQCGGTPPTCQSVPIDVGLDSPVYVTLYTTGLRGRSSDAAVKVTIGGQSIPIRSITSDDDSGAEAGVDEIQIVLPLSLRGSGEVEVVISVDGTTSNHGVISIQ
jgi:uncharacterized protein (TIGR03437 family)